MGDFSSHAEATLGQNPGEADEPESAARGGARVEVVDASGRLSGDGLGWLERHAAGAAAVLGLGGEVRVRVVCDPEMAAAHLEYCEVEGTTDVLTFDMSEADDSGRPVLDVDILACIDEAERQGAARGHGRERELLLYIVHGVLHCLGHDDHDEAAAAAMHAEEDRVLGAIGVGRTFGAPERGGDAIGGGA